jgi:hypothetical protein
VRCRVDREVQSVGGDNCFVNNDFDQSTDNIIRVAQRKRGGPITHRSQDRNLALISLYFFSFFCTRTDS